MTQSESPQWNRPTKVGVAIAAILFVLVVLWRFQSLISPLIIAIIMAYLLNPIIVLVDDRTALSRNGATNLVFSLLVVGIIAAVIALGVALYNQAVSLIEQIPSFIETMPARIEEIWASLNEPIMIGSFSLQLPLPETQEIDWGAVSQQILGYINPIISSVGSSLGQIAIMAIETLGWFIFIIFTAIYVSNDIPRMGSLIGDVATLPGYREDAERLWRDFGRIWNAYLRGQAILGIIIFVVVAAVLGALGVQNALVLGLISGLLEFIPMVGPIIGTGAAVVVAFFQPENYLGLGPVQFTLVVLAVMLVIQQVENSVLVPRIVGDALDLHPILVLVGAIMGSSLGGILGAILAAPVIASIKLVGTYAWRKMFDLDPFPMPEEEDGDKPSFMESMWEQWQLRRARMRGGKPNTGSPKSKGGSD
ncbi:MAG: AI-2E family transporter [Chloroflexi bacterium]|nr:AI-2E family transporter [Chloroflexota bacterium]